MVQWQYYWKEEIDKEKIINIEMQVGYQGYIEKRRRNSNRRTRNALYRIAQIYKEKCRSQDQARAMVMVNSGKGG